MYPRPASHCVALLSKFHFSLRSKKAAEPLPSSGLQSGGGIRSGYPAPPPLWSNVSNDHFRSDRKFFGVPGRDASEGPPPPPLHSAQPLLKPHSPLRQAPASVAFVTDSNRPLPLWQPPPTACLMAFGTPSEVSWSPKGLVHNLLVQFFTLGSSKIEVFETYSSEPVIT